MLSRLAILAVAAVLVAALAALAPTGAREAIACAFSPRVPNTYEADGNRSAYLLAMEAAARDLLFPGDSYFGVPALEVGGRGGRSPGPREVPAILLKAIGWAESNTTMASRSVPFDSPGRGLVSFDCGHGIMQITTGMTVPLGSDNKPTDRQVMTATHYAYNIARGAAMLAEKWNQAPEIRPIAGVNTNSDPNLIENWYYAVWSYNGFTGPGSNQSNHPLDPTFGGWPRAAYRCDGNQSRARYPYQELVWGCMAHPPTRNGQALWQPMPATLPDLTNPAFFTPMSPARFVFPYTQMDIPTPQPAHTEPSSSPGAGVRAQLLGGPVLSVSSAPVSIRMNSESSATRATVEVRNSGTGIAGWSATTTDNWLTIEPPAGVALGSDMPCNSSGCTRHGTIEVSINPTLLPASRATGTLRVTSPNGGGQAILIRVDVFADFEVGAPGTSRVY